MVEASERRSEVESLITENWPAINSRLTRDLAGWRMDPATREDIAQEVLARALVDKNGFDSLANLLRWSRTVAHNLAVAWYRDRDRVWPVDGALPDRRTSVDVEREIEGRLALSLVGQHLRALPEEHQEAIHALILGDQASTRRETVLLAVRRHRARARLRELFDGVAALVAIRVRGIEHLAGSVAGLAAVLIVPALVGLALGPLPSHAPGAAPDDFRRLVGAVVVPNDRASPRPADPTPVAQREPRRGRTTTGTGPVTSARAVGAKVNGTVYQSPFEGGTLYELHPSQVSVDLDNDGTPEAALGAHWQTWCPPEAERGVLSGVACPALERLDTAAP